MSQSKKVFLSEADLKARGHKASDSTRWRMERAGTHPKRRHPSPNRKAWIAVEIEAYEAAVARGEEWRTQR